MIQQFLRDQVLETYRSMASLAAGAIRSVILIYGGAAVALLTFVGNVSDGGTAADPPSFMWPMVLFMLGIFFGAFAAGGAYLTQLAFYREQLQTASAKWWDRHNIWLYSSLAAFMLGLLCFIAGGIMAAILLA